MKSDNREIEIKIRLDDSGALFNKALELGGEELPEKEGLEHDVMYDNGKGFYDFPKVLRLRTAPFGNLLTYKEKTDESDKDNFLVRTEIETYVQNPEAVNLILEKLGFRPYRIKEKYVKKIKLDNLILEFHKLPFLGDFLEVEGSKDEIAKILSKLSLDLMQGINKDYSALFFDYCAKHDLRIDTPQTFEQEKKLGLQKPTI